MDEHYAQACEQQHMRIIEPDSRTAIIYYSRRDQANNKEDIISDPQVGREQSSGLPGTITLAPALFSEWNASSSEIELSGYQEEDRNSTSSTSAFYLGSMIHSSHKDGLDEKPYQDASLLSSAQVQFPGTSMMVGTNQAFHQHASRPEPGIPGAAIASLASHLSTPNLQSIDHQVMAENEHVATGTIDFSLSQYTAGQNHQVPVPISSTHKPLDPRLTHSANTHLVYGPWLPMESQPWTQYRIVTRVRDSTFVPAKLPQEESDRYVIATLGAPPAGPPPPVAMWSTVNLSQSSQSRDVQDKDALGRQSKMEENSKYGQSIGGERVMYTNLVEQPIDIETASHGPDHAAHTATTLSEDDIFSFINWELTADAQSSESPILQHEQDVTNTNNLTCDETASSHTVKDWPAILPFPSAPWDTTLEDDFSYRRAFYRGLAMSDAEIGDCIQANIRECKITHQKHVPALDDDDATSSSNVTHSCGETPSAMSNDSTMTDMNETPTLDAAFASRYAVSHPPIDSYHAITQADLEPMTMDYFGNVGIDIQRRAPEEQMMSEERAVLEHAFMTLEASKDMNECEMGWE